MLSPPLFGPLVMSVKKMAGAGVGAVTVDAPATTTTAIGSMHNLATLVIDDPIAENPKCIMFFLVFCLHRVPEIQAEACRSRPEIPPSHDRSAQSHLRVSALEAGRATGKRTGKRTGCFPVLRFLTTVCDKLLP